MSADEAASPRPRRVKVSYRISLLVAIPALVVLLSGLIILQNYITTTREVSELAHSLFRDLSRQAFHRTNEHLGAAREIVNMLQDLSNQGRLGEDRRTLGGELMAALRSHADYSWVSFSGEDGSFTGAYRGSDGSLIVNASWFVGDKVKMEDHRIEDDGRWTLLRTLDDFKYDPRGRPFYTRAAKAGQPIWTPPYVFFGQGIPGITYAAPRFDRQGKRIGVWSVDFDLNRLSDLMRQAGGAGTIFMFTPDGTLLAHPEVKVVEVEEGKEGHLLKLSDVRDPVLRAYAAATRGLDLAPAAAGVAEENVRRLSFSVDGNPYLAAGTAYRINEEFTLVVGQAAPESIFLDPIRRNLRAALGIALIVLAIGFIVAIVFANTVSRPLLQMADEMDRVANFDLREAPTDRSIFREIDRMNHSLSGMVRSLKSFAAYVPRDLVRMLVTTGQVARLEGQTKRLTMFFSDVAGFTSLSEQLAPNELVQRLGAYLSDVATIVGREGGTVDKFMGDGVMAFWNAPQEQPDHAIRAVRAAMACQDFLTRQRDAGPDEADRALPTRIGLATGEVVVGNIGSLERMNYTVIGDTANLASRLEALNKVYGTSILMSNETATEVRDKILCRPVDVVAVVGKLQGVKIWEPLGPADDASAPAHIALVALTTQALEAYQERDIATALRLYQKMRDAHPADSVAALMAQRCDDLLRKGIPKDWSGTTTFRHKE